MPSIIYNDDVEMNSPSLYDGPNENSSISDESTPGTNPWIQPYPVIDGTNRVSDGWGKNLSPDGGTGGTEYTDIPPVEKTPLVYYTKTIKEKTKIVIRDYTSAYLQNLDSQGFKFYAVYTDGTEDEVDYNEVYDPHQISEGIYVNEAQEIADAINQHFWYDDNGAHVTDVEQDDWKTAANASFNDISDNKPYHNILMNSLGILLRRALNNLVSISRSGMTIFDGLGNSIENVLASFTSAGAAFRESGKTRATVTTQGLTVYDNSGSVSNGSETFGAQVAFIGIDSSGKPYSRIGKSTKGFVEIGVNSSDNGYIDFYNNDSMLAHIGYDAGADSSGGTSNAPYYNFGIRRRNTTIGNYSCVEGFFNVASGYCSHAEAYVTDALGYCSHAEGSYTTASGYCSHAEGYKTSVTKDYAHAEGRETIAEGNNSHAEGYKTEVSGDSAHAEGYNTRASGGASHAEGYDSFASGGYSHVEGYKCNASETSAHAEGYNTSADGKYSHVSGLNTVAASDCQFVCGKNNSNLSSDLFEIGNGSSSVQSNRANAFRVTTSNAAYMGSTAVTSDKRIKTDLGELNPSQAIDFIKELIPHKYEKFGRKELGFFAQDVEKDPNYGNILVEQYEDHGYKDFRSLSYDGLIAPIVSVEQNLLARIEQLEQENAELKQHNKDLNDRLTRIEKMLKI